MYYNARWYDPGLGRFAQADTIVPLASQGVQAWDRYAGMNNNPVRYNDPSGNEVFDSTKHPLTFTITSASSFIVVAQKAHTQVDFLKSMMNFTLVGGSTLLGLGVGIPTAFVSGMPGAGVVGGGTVALGAYSMASEIILGQYDIDLQNLENMQVFVNSLFTDKETEEVTIKLSYENVVLNENTSPVTIGMIQPITLQIQVITICSNTGVCSTYRSSICPSAQSNIERNFKNIENDRRKQKQPEKVEMQ